jgi:hypothetical protein
MALLSPSLSFLFLKKLSTTAMLSAMEESLMRQQQQLLQGESHGRIFRA